MKIDVYKSNKSPKYLVVPAGKRASELTLTDKDFSEVSIFKKDIEIALNKSFIGINQEAALAGILANGYYVMGVKIEINTH